MTDDPAALHDVRLGWRWVVCGGCGMTFTVPLPFHGNPACAGCGRWPLLALVQAPLFATGDDR
jgi:hypothetical protein